MRHRSCPPLAPHVEVPVMKMKTAWKPLVIALALVLGVVLSPARALADKIHLKNGTVVEGTVVKEVQGYVWFKAAASAVDKPEVYSPDQIDRIERDAGTPKAPEVKPAEVKPTEAKPTDAKPMEKAGAAAPAEAAVAKPAEKTAADSKARKS